MVDEYTRYHITLNIKQPNYSFSYSNHAAYTKQLNEYNEMLSITFYKLVNEIVELGGIVEVNKYFDGNPYTYFYASLSDEAYKQLLSHKDIKGMVNQGGTAGW